MTQESKQAGGRGLLVVIAGPAGSGKGTVVSELMRRDDRLAYSVSATTRAPRPGEEHGRQYYFLSREEFERRIAEGRMLEYAEYCGNFYGTPRDETERALAEGRTLLLEIEVQGATQVKRLFPDAILIMILPPTFEVLEARLRGRATDSEESITHRLRTSRDEVGRLSLFDYILTNEDGCAADVAEAVLGILSAERHAVSRNPGVAARFFGEAAPQDTK